MDVAPRDAEARALLLLAASGVFQAAFAVPAKYRRGWRWEQIWDPDQLGEAFCVKSTFHVSASISALAGSAAPAVLGKARRRRSLS